MYDKTYGSTNASKHGAHAVYHPLFARSDPLFARIIVDLFRKFQTEEFSCSDSQISWSNYTTLVVCYK